MLGLLIFESQIRQYSKFSFVLHLEAMHYMECLNPKCCPTFPNGICEIHLNSLSALFCWDRFWVAALPFIRWHPISNGFDIVFDDLTKALKKGFRHFGVTKWGVVVWNGNACMSNMFLLVPANLYSLVKVIRI